MEKRRLEETDPQSLRRLRRGWFLGGEQFRQERLQRVDGCTTACRLPALQHRPNSGYECK